MYHLWPPAGPFYIAMVTRLDRYILREHLGPFLFALLVILVVLVVDFVPDVVRMVVTKGLPPGVISQIFLLNLAWMFALAVPMAALAATLLSFGRMAADSEVVALKAAGVSLFRIVMPVLLASAALAAGLIYFNNEILPDANHQARQLMTDVRRKRPTLELRANVLEDAIPGYHLLIKSIDDKANGLGEVTIFDHKNRTDPRTVAARSGNMRYSEDGRTLILELFDGEVHEPDPADPHKYRRMAFQQQTFYLGGVGDEFSRSESEYRTDREKSAAQMQREIDGWEKGVQTRWQSLHATCSIWVSAVLVRKPDSVDAVLGLPVSDPSVVHALSSDDAGTRAKERALRVSALIDRELATITNQNRLIGQYLIEIHKKYSIPAACVVFTLIGCPLGVRARRGGVATGVGVSILVFLVFWAFLIGGEDLADRGIVSPFWAMWSANILIGVLGVVLLWRGSNESFALSFKNASANAGIVPERELSAGEGMPH